jgi:hypothetical protein
VTADTPEQLASARAVREQVAAEIEAATPALPAAPNAALDGPLAARAAYAACARIARGER